MLIGWYLGRRAVKNARQDVMSLAQYSSASTQAEIAARLLRKMGRMDRVHRAGDLTATIEEASYLLKEAVRDRHHSMNEGARNGRDARWLEATLMESLAMTYLGALKAPNLQKAIRSSGQNSMEVRQPSHVAHGYV